jgi:hypothetical protein
MWEAGIVDWYVPSLVTSADPVPRPYLSRIPLRDDLLQMYCLMLMLDVFLGSGDVLFRVVLSETWSATITSPMDSWPHRLYSKFHYPFNPSNRPKRLHNKLHTLNMDT